MQPQSVFYKLKLPSMERHILCATLITVYKLFHGYLNVSSEEFFEPPAAGNLRGHNFKVRQPRSHLARQKADFAVRSPGPWNRLPPHRWSSDSVQLQGSLGCQLVLHLPWHCLTLPNSLFLCKWFWRASAIVQTSKLDLTWFDLIWLIGIRIAS